ITGSIGVFGLLFNGEALADKLGVRTTTLERGALPGPSVLHPMSDAQRAALQSNVDATYERFLDAVTTGRGAVSGLKKDDLRPIAEGHVWTGAQAKERKLVDNIGGLAEALQDARKRAQLGEDEDVGLDIITGHEDDLQKLTGLASVLAPQGADAATLKAALTVLLGDPAALQFALAHDGQPLAIDPVTIRVR
ncbi:MAG TPA: S49 family peptidase, partial [Myxococcota bacterium]